MGGIFPFKNSGIKLIFEWSLILTHLFLIVPISLIDVVTTSPCLSNLPWVAPTPDGVPVNIRSPVFNVKNSDI